MAFSQVLLSDVTANKDTNDAILTMLELDKDLDLQYHVYEVAYGTKKLFCCLSGGQIENGEIVFTPIGLAAFEALTNVDSGDDAEYFADFVSNDEDIEEQLEVIFARVPDGAKVCLVGDITGALKDELAKYFTLLN